MPELAHKIKMYFALAPIATVKYARSPGTKFLLLPDMMIKVCDSPDVSLCLQGSLSAQFLAMHALNRSSFVPEYIAMDIISSLIFTGIIWQTRIFISD